MAIRRFNSSDSTEIWEHLNRLSTDAEAEVAAARPFSVATSYAAGTSFASGQFVDRTVSWPTRATAPQAVIPVMTSSPGGSARMIPRVANIGLSSAVIRVYNAGDAISLSATLSVSCLVVP